ncbi:MAG: hypothetical protein Q9198_004096 [Flavoplaca austrocitrina]
MTPVNHLHAERARSNYLRPFAILLAIGYGIMIRHFVEHRELQDQSLPFTTEPEGFPKTSTQNLFEAFYKEQWQFCAVPLEYDMRDYLADDYILPITAKEQISGGGSAILYKITVDEAYNKLKPADDAHTAARSRNTNTFTLKTYRTPDARKYFENERNAFEQLRYGGGPPENIIKYYGSFARHGTYNIILEYADRGTLDDYMKNTAEPKTVIEIRSFWENFLASMRGLVQIHGTHEPASDGPNIVLGWHHDIDPSNILVVSKGQDSPYDCDFKIADLGLAHFKRYISSLNNAPDNDKYGMSTYGAPETFRSTDLEKCHLLVPQNADIWSMGCVYSEVATWVTEGSHKLLEYRRRRQQEIAKKLGVALSGEDRFHHVSKVLETVNEIHAEIEHNSRRCDPITPCVVEKIVKAMVRPHPQSRGAAQFLLETSSEILEDAESDSSETASIASFAWSNSSKSSVSSGASDTLVAGLDETTEFFLSDEELRDLFAKAFTTQSRKKVLRNGVRLLKWLGRRLVISATTTIEKEAAEFFLSRNHGRSIMNRIALQISDNPIVKGTQGQSSMKREKVETHLQQLSKARSVKVGAREPSTLKAFPTISRVRTRPTLKMTSKLKKKKNSTSMQPSHF